jgi:hypothetical protein
MAHEIGNTWSSFLYDANNRRFNPDLLGNFDLRNMSDAGDAAGCTHGGQNITGRARRVDLPPTAYFVEFDQTASVVAHYKGVVLRHLLGGQPVRTISGSVVFVVNVEIRKIMQIDERVLDGTQLEATWVATQP